MSDYSYRFSGIARLYGVEALERIRNAHVCVVGVGGVGSWTVEALARSGVGKLTLIDMDDVCLSNANRQLHALDGTVGQLKIDVMAQRVKAIQPEGVVSSVADFFTASTAESHLEPEYDVLIDAIDQPANKCLLIDGARKRKMPVVTVGAAGGKWDPTAVQVADLTRVSYDALLKRVRKSLRREFGYSRDPKKKWAVDAVFSTEQAVYPSADGGVCEKPDPDASLKLDCASGFGSATHVTGTFGFAAASVALRRIINAG